MQLSNDQARQLHDAGGFLVLSDLPPGSTFGIDGSMWAVASRFMGLKLLPPGLHLVVASAASASDDPELLSAGIGGVRHAFLHFVKSQETLIRRWDEANESFDRPRKRTRMNSGADTEMDLIDRDHLRGIDANLAPYPFGNLAAWRQLTDIIDEKCIGRVMGFDQRGDAHADALMGAAGELDGSQHSSHQQTWGKPRAANADLVSNVPDELLNFANFDLKRSWRQGAVGEEVTKDARDKSRLLQDVVKAQLAGDPQQLLAELQLAFILFVYVHSFSSLEVFKRILSLICRSPAALDDDLMASLVATLLSRVLAPQLQLLHNDAQAHELVELDAYFIQELQALKTNLKAVHRQHDNFLKQAWATLEGHSGLSLGALDAESIATRNGMHHYDLLKVDPDESDEDDEDKPQVVLDVADHTYEEPDVRGLSSRPVDGRDERPARPFWRVLEEEDDEVQIRW